MQCNENGLIHAKIATQTEHSNEHIPVIANLLFLDYNVCLYFLHMVLT